MLLGDPSSWPVFCALLQQREQTKRLSLHEVMRMRTDWKEVEKGPSAYTEEKHSRQAPVQRPWGRGLPGMSGSSVTGSLKSRAAGGVVEKHRDQLHEVAALFIWLRESQAGN